MIWQCLSKPLGWIMRMFKKLSKHLINKRVKHAGKPLIFDPYVRWWYFLGILPYEEFRRPSWRSHVAYIYPRFVFVTACFQSFIIIGIYIFINRSNLLLVIDGVSLISVYLMAAAKPINFVLQKNRMMKIMKTLDRFHSEGRYGNKYEIDVYRKTKVFIKWFAVYIAMAGTGIGCILFVVAMITMIPRKLMIFQGWFPYDETISPYLEFTIAYRLITILMNLQIIGLCDSVMCALLGVTLAQFKILHIKFETIRECAVRNVEDEKRKRQPFRGPGPRPHEKIHPQVVGSSQFVLLTPRPRAARHASPMQSGNQDLAYKVAIDREMERLMKLSVIRHQELLRLTGELEILINPILINQLCTNMVSGCCMALSYTMDSTITPKTFYFGALVLCMLVELFLYSWFGNQITQESEDIKFSVYSSDWLEASESYKRSVRIVISRSHDPVLFRAAGFIPLSMEIFHSVTNSGYSNYMVLRTLAEK